MLPVRCKKSVRLVYQLSQLLGLLSQRDSSDRPDSISIPDKDHNCYGSKKIEILIENNNMEKILKRIR